MESLEDRLAQAEIEKAAAAAKPKVPEDGETGGTQSRLDMMLQRLNSIEQTLSRDAAPPTTLPASSASVAPKSSRLGDAPREDDTSPKSGELEQTADSLIAELERAAARPHEAFLIQLRRYQEVTPWPMPLGHRKRLSAPYLARVYKMGNTVVEYARTFIRTHALDKCVPVQELLTIMEAVDDAIITDDKDVINSVAFEKLTRRAYGLEKAY